MKEDQKIYIKGNLERGSEIIKILTDLGGRNSHFLNGKNPNAYYFINPNGIIVNNYYIGSEAFSYVKEFYKEITLPKWKPKYEEQFFFIYPTGIIGRNKWYETNLNESYYEFGNCFKTKEEAEAARDKIKNFLNNDK